MTADVSTEHPVVLFDGVCNLCTGSVQFLVERDPEGVFRFAPLQSSVAEDLLADTDVDPDDLDSVVVIDDGRVYEKSNAILRVAAYLGGIYRLLPPFRYLPKRLRNLVYDFVAARRYDWFGQKEQCMMPTPELQSRFLAGGPGPNFSDTQDES